MQVRKQKFTILLLFANILLLAHGILPHIHHDGIICMANAKVGQAFSDYECSDCDCCWKHAVEHEDNTQHHGEVEDCDLPSLLQRDERASVHSATDALATFPLLYIILPEHIGCFCFSSYLLEAESAEPPYIYDYAEPFVGTIRSLRAPPVYFLG